MTFRWRYVLVIAALMAGSLLLACDGEEAAPEATPSPAVEATPSPTAVATPSPTPSATPAPQARGRIAYGCFVEATDICVMDEDGGNPVNLTRGELEPLPVGEPTCSPDGDKIAFRVGQEGGAEVYVMDADGGNRLNLTDNQSILDAGPAWSPDGSRIAFDRSSFEDPEQSGLFLMDPDGSGIVRISEIGVGPAWSPDGSKVAFTVGGLGADILVMSADGTNPVNLTDSPDSAEHDPTWSPDGQRIAFVFFSAEAASMSDIYVMNSDGSQLTNLTDTPDRFEMDPAWLPDGRIVFVAGPAGGSPDIYSMRSDGSDVVNLTNTPEVVESAPTWCGPQP